MNEDIAIEVDHLSKRYRLGLAPAARYETLRDTLMRVFKAPLQNQRQQPDPSSLWALDDVSLEIKAGQVVAIIGGNGAGKSTLLKILSRITLPTRGRARIYGRVGSLLEVGTGFHPELSGRENIHLNGAILGMTRVEIARKFDEIVAFSEVERFIDTAVKYYSSGMYVRLAFAVAAHLEPEILIVDEVLSVGDSRFQQKCLGKIDDVAKGGRTVLFVSHNMAAVYRLATSAVWMDRGKVARIGTPHSTVAAYLGGERRGRYVAEARKSVPHLLEAEILGPGGQPASRVLNTDPVTVRLRYHIPQRHSGLVLGIGVLSADGTALFTTNTNDVAADVPEEPGEYDASVTIPPDVLLVGEYHVAVCIWDYVDIFDLHEPAVSFAVEHGPSVLYAMVGERKGFVHIPCSWGVDGLVPTAALVAEAECVARAPRIRRDREMRPDADSRLMRAGGPGSPARVFQRDGVAVGPREK
ncbi:MAG TPA: ABC transporter ATP-binding protein [Vicinamibacterales bacterium]|nr:ABC transporter ATP-binding protein [Vicinamibacterales bacterium]